VLPKTNSGLRGDCLPPVAVDRSGMFTHHQGGRIIPRRGQVQANSKADFKLILRTLVISFFAQTSFASLLWIYYIL